VIEYLFAVSGVLALAAIIRGPTFADRALASGAFMNIAVIILLLLAMRAGEWLYLDVSIAIIFMNFVGTLAIARYARRKR
jgi:multisubunit Na+/H+ antiporter MnhF subunit